MFESAFVPFFFRLLSRLPPSPGRRCLGGPASDGTLCVRSGQLPANRKGKRAPIPAGRRLVNVPNEVRCTTCFRPFVTRYCRPTGRLPAPLHHHLSRLSKGNAEAKYDHGWFHYFGAIFALGSRFPDDLKYTARACTYIHKHTHHDDHTNKNRSETQTRDPVLCWPSSKCVSKIDKFRHVIAPDRINILFL